MNYMPEVAKLLGVEIGEEFNIDDKVCKYKFTDSCLMWHNRFDNCWIDGSHRLNDLIIGKNKIIKLSKPILDEVEKKYLSRVIRPFRDSVVAILKEAISWDHGKVKLVVMLALNNEKILDYEEVFSNIYNKLDTISKVVKICENKSYDKFIKLFE